MSRNKTIYTTSEYIDGLRIPNGFNYWQLKGKEFGLFPTKEAAEKDAQFLVDFYKREGTRKKKPTVYLIKLEKVQ